MFTFVIIAADLRGWSSDQISFIGVVNSKDYYKRWRQRSTAAMTTISSALKGQQNRRLQCPNHLRWRNCTFSAYVLKYWNNLPASTVKPFSLLVFKTQLDHQWRVLFHEIPVSFVLTYITPPICSFVLILIHKLLVFILSKTLLLSLTFVDTSTFN